MRVLFVGGTGLISTACTRLALERGIEVVHLNRSSGGHPIEGVTTLVADVHDEAAAARALTGQTFDAVVDCIAFGVEDIERDIRLFRDRTYQFVFISSASAYHKPLVQWLVREDTPLVNPFWDYARNKAACEERLLRAYREDGFPITIVRPSHTYGDWSMPLAVTSWEKPFTSIARWRAGKPLIVPGDGSSLWTLTHNTDFAVGFVGLLGLRQAIGHAFHITSDEVLTWDEIHRQTAAAAGVEPRIVHISTDFIAACLPEMSGRLIGDAAVSSVFDNTKIKRFVPEFRPVTPYAQGIRQTIAWFDADPARQQVDAEADARWDRLIAVYERGLARAVAEFK
ncbi:MAG: NAD-dependent epimerase/dehydratase family protein [Candidatus Limnocylindrales bacterium]